MKFIRSIDPRIGYIVASLGLMFAVIGSAFVPTFAGATGLLNSRSIAMTSSASGATGVSYNLTFTPSNAIGATGSGIIIEFCENNPIISLACTTSGANADVNTTSVTLGAVSYNGTAETGGNAGTVAAENYDTGAADDAIAWTSGAAYTTAGPVSITFNNLTNPTISSGQNDTVYARITTYSSGFSSEVSSFSATSVGTPADQGGVALGITNSTQVTAYVMESLSFCVAKTADYAGSYPAPSQGCGNGNGTLIAPSLTLGQSISGGGSALDSNDVSTGTDTAQLSTNAASGAVVNLQSSTACGGLKRTASGVTTCDIAPQDVGANNITAGNALFGLEVGSSSAATGGTGSASGTFEAAHSSSYSASKYFIDYNSGSPTTAGITSPYGSPLLDTGSSPGPVSNENIPITFGASVSNTTPAGIYTANLNMIATGTF